MQDVRHSTAYDLSLFDARTTKVSREDVVNMVREKKKACMRKSAFKTIAFCMVFVCVFAAYVFSYTQLTEATSKINSLKSQKEELNNQYKQLTVAYDAMVDLRAVENIAVNQYHMVKADKNRVEYLSMSEKDNGQVLATQKTFTLSEFFPNTFRRLSAIFEYLG